MVRGWKPCEWVLREVSDWNAFLLLFFAHTQRQRAKKKKKKKLDEQWRA